MIAQIWIALFGLTSSFLVYSANAKHRRWAPVLAVIAQPAWYWSCISAHQWGVLVLTFFYTCLHVRGLWKLWVLKPAPVVVVESAESATELWGRIMDKERARIREVPWQERAIEGEFGSRN
jgi:hypothetical protein